MNAIQLLSAQPWVERLGLTLLHFLWQGILIAAVYEATRRWSNWFGSPSARYGLACTALAILAVAPVLTWEVLSPAHAESFGVPLTGTVSTTAFGSVRDIPAFFAIATDGAVQARFMPWVVVLWIAGAMTFWLRLLGGWLFAAQLSRRLVHPAPREWQLALDRLKVRIRVSRPVRLLVSSLVQAPGVVGCLRPVVLVPAGALVNLPAEQIEALLVHELAHIRRHDYLVNILQSVIEALLFYHPAVWWISGHMRAERELCCDDEAVGVYGDVLTYTRALAEMESARASHCRSVMAATGGSLAHRIGRLTGEPRPTPRTLSGPGVLAAGVLLGATMLALFGQPAARPKFEVASIKPSLGQGFMIVRRFPGRLAADASVRLLVQNAYGVLAPQVVGGPEWTSSKRYAIEAKADGQASRVEIFLMLQSLLEDRFRLKIHRETRELPIYTLVAARSGLKLPAPKEGDCVHTATDAPPEWSGGRIAPPAQGPSPLGQCGSVSVTLQAAGARMQGGAVPMPELIRMLSIVLGRTVVDKTGFTGFFDVTLDFQPDETTPAMPPPPPGQLPDFPSPSILTALQEKLGLRLESAKGPVEVIAIDDVAQPTVN